MDRLLGDTNCHRPTRRVYEITSKGEENVQWLLREILASYHPASHSIAIIITFLISLSPDEAISLLAQRSKETDAIFQAINQIDKVQGCFNSFSW